MLLLHNPTLGDLPVQAGLRISSFSPQTSDGMDSLRFVFAFRNYKELVFH